MSEYRENYRAIGLFLFVMLGNAATIVTVRYVSEAGSYSPFQFVFLANIIGALGCVILKFTKPLPMLPTRHWRLFSLRATLEFVAFSASFYAITQLPLPMHTALLFMTPIFGTVIALSMLHERGSWASYGCIAVGFAGVLLITRPWGDGFSLEGGIAFALLAALLFASCGSMIKLLTRAEHPRRIAFNMLWMTGAIAAPFALSQWQSIALEHWPWFAGLGLIAFTIQHAIAMSLARVPFMSVIPLNFAQLVLVCALAFILFDETVNSYTIVGSVIILAATVFNSWYSARHVSDMAAREDKAEDERDAA